MNAISKNLFEKKGYGGGAENRKSLVHVSFPKEPQENGGIKLY